MPRFGWKYVLLAVLTVCCAAPAIAQSDRDDDRDRSRRRFDPTELLKRMDDNGNGQLEPEEISDRARRFIDEAAGKAGLDPKQPLSIDKLVAAMQRNDDDDDNDKPKDGESSPMTDGGNAGSSAEGTPSTVTPPATDTKSTAPSSVVIGFGTQKTLTPPPGFGPLPTDEKSSEKSGSSGSGSSSRGSSRSGSSDSSDRKEQVQKVRRYAEGLMKQYDENKNGVLEKDEWKKMRGDPEKADANNDKIITVDELSDRLASYGSDGGRSDRGSEDNRDERSSDRGRSRERESTSTDKKSFRFLTPTERLPKGLPTWFARNDANADGQVSMAEYSTSYNETTAAEFAKYDGDGDGIITPQECLQAEADKSKTTSTSTSTGSSSGSSSSPYGSRSPGRFGR